MTSFRISNAPARLRHHLARLGTSRHGVVAEAVGICFVMICLLLGAAVDYSRMQQDRITLNAAMDAAVIAAVQAMKTADTQGLTDAQSILAGQTAGSLVFTSFDPPTIARTGATGSFAVTINGRNVSVTGSFTASTATTVMNLALTRKIPFNGTSTASLTLSPYVDVYLLIDVSGSMAIGATQADINALLSGIGCAFACHDGSPVNGTSMDSYQWARANGITLRLQEMNTGIQQFVTWLQNQPNFAKHVRIAIYSFSTGLTKVLDPTSNLASVSANLPQAPSTSGESDGATLWSTIMPQVTPLVGTSGDGVTTPKKLVIVASDGVADPGRFWTYLTQYRANVAPFDPQQCSGLKGAGVSVGVIYTPYLPMTWDWGYNATLGQPSQIGGAGTRLDDIPGQLTACASTGLYVDASKSGSIGQAMQQVFQSFSQLKITN
ncbi:pilus assembly protein TadG-related protein [Methylobacterium sp. JK268]